MRHRFDGEIAGVGTAGGTRVVIGRWPRSPFGDVTDVMVERPDGHRVLLAPTPELAEYVAATYTFDEVQVTAVRLSETSRRQGHRRWLLEAGPLRLRVDIGARTALGRLLRAVPTRVASWPAFSTLVDPVARVVLRGVRTRGSAGAGRREWYGAQDAHRVEAADGTWDGAPLGALAPVLPPVRFGFGSTPATPAVVRVVSTVEVPDTESGRAASR